MHILGVLWAQWIVTILALLVIAYCLCRLHKHEIYVFIAFVAGAVITLVWGIR